jgi:hypothetical protein
MSTPTVTSKFNFITERYKVRLLRLIESRMLRGICGTKRWETWEIGGIFLRVRNFKSCL